MTRPSGALLRHALLRRRRDLVPATVLVIGHQLCEAAVPVVVGVAIDRAVATGDGGSLLLWLGVVAGVFVLLASCGLGGYWLYSRAEFSIRRDLRIDLVERAVDARGGLGRDRRTQATQLVGIAGTDAARAATVTDAVLILCGPGAALVAGSAFLLAASPVLAGTVLVGAVLVLVLSQLLARPLVGRAEKEQESLAAATAVATDLVTGLRVLKGIGAEDAAAAAYARTSRSALAARLHAVRLEGAYTAATGVLTGLFLTVVALVGGLLALDRTISIGDLVAAVGLAQFLMEPLEALTVVGPLVAGSRAAGGRIATVLDSPPAVVGGTASLPQGGRAVGIQVRLADLAVHAAPGEHLGVVADDAAAGDLLAALGRDDPAGQVLLDGTDLADLDLDTARAAVVVARHDSVLFEGSIRDNLSPVSPGGVDWAAVLAASATEDVVAGRAQGLDEPIGERGRQLSGGQRQRVALARALATEAPLLVLHDPTTAVDAATEDRVADGIRRHRAGRTTVHLTSSPALLARCDRVLLVRDGVVRAEGSHAELVAVPAYREAVLT